nr:putative aaa domain-containing protein c16e9.10c [Quercus suber]
MPSEKSRLQGALDTDIHTVVLKFLDNGVDPTVNALYSAIQRSNSSLKRKPKKVLHASLERVLDFIDGDGDASSAEDSQAEIEERLGNENYDADIMNRSLRANLAGAAPVPASHGTTIANAGATGGEMPRKRHMANGEPLPKRVRTDKMSVAPPTDVSLDDLGGMDDVMEQLSELLVQPLLAPEEYAELNVKLPHGVLLHGPPGCGKTMLARAFASTIDVPFIEILGPSIVSGMSGESEKGLRERFEEAKRNAPCLIFMDEIDAITPKRESSQSQMEKRIVTQLLVSMDELHRDSSKPVIVLATTNRPDSIDPALRRGGRFDTEIIIPVPNEQVRQHILRAQTRTAPIADDVDFAQLAKMTAGFVGSDLHDLVNKAGNWQLSTYFNALRAEAVAMREEMDVDGSSSSNPSTKAESIRLLAKRLRRKDLPRPAGFDHKQISMAAFRAVLPGITPSSKREGFATIPNVSWDDIGALQSVRQELEEAIVHPIKAPEQFEAIGISVPTGVLLWGPPGCGKTLLAKAVAAESKANFISIKGPELLNKYVGESEAAVRRVFTRARSSAPCVIFFDELDALAPRRDDALSDSSSRVVNTLLTELDGLSERQGIYIIAATNRPDIIDEAMLRPGRLETPLFIDLPGSAERVEILRTLLRNKPVDGVEAVVEFARTDVCKGYSGADLSALVRQAGRAALARASLRMEMQDFVDGSGKVKASVGDIEKYHRLKEKFVQTF